MNFVQFNNKLLSKRLIKSNVTHVLFCFAFSFDSWVTSDNLGLQ